MTRLGTYRRAIRLELGETTARGEMEDDAHHFAVTLAHDGDTVQGIRGEPFRTPWSICPASVGVLDRLVGLPLDIDRKVLLQKVAGAEQCTHMLDLAAQLMRHAAVGTAARTYSVAIPIDDIKDAREATLERDGTIVLRWIVADQTILGPGHFADLSLRHVNGWARVNIPDPDMLEAVAILQRAVLTSVGRVLNLDRLASAAPLAGKLGPCFVFREGQVEKAKRMVGSTIDFTARRGPLEMD